MPVRVTKDDAVLKQIIANLPNNTDDFVRILSVQTDSDAKESFGSGPPGKTYQRGNVEHVASSPGFPPNTDIGTLIATIKAVKVADNHHRAQAGTDYALPLEDGTTEIAPRPFMRPAARRTKERFPRSVQRFFRIK